MFSGILAEKVQELFLFDFEVIGELFRGQVVRKDISEGLALLFEQFEGEGVILFQGAGPGMIRGQNRFVERHPFEDERGELGRPVGGGGETALCRGVEPGCCVQANGVAQEAGYAASVFGCDPKFRPGWFFPAF